MGFLDGLFGGKKQETVRLSVLDAWLNGRLKSEAGGVLKEAQDILASADETVSRLRQDVEALSAKGFNDIDPRYDKIVRTAKPAYVKSMLLALEGIEYKGGGLEEVRAHVSRLSSALDTIGKVSFGDGKFLPFAFQAEMNHVQADCRKLLDLKEELDEVLSSSKELESLSAISKAHQEYLALTERLRKVKADAQAHARAAEEGKAKVGSLEAELESLHASLEYRNIGEAKDKLAKAESSAKHIESKVHSALSPLKSGMRKYEKAVFDRGLGKMAAATVEDPVIAYFGSGSGEMGALLDSFATLCQNGTITLKDQEKTLRKVEAAKAELSKDLRPEYQRLRDESAKLRHAIREMPAAAKEESIKSQISAQQQTIERSQKEAAESKLKAEELEGESKKALEKLKAEINGLGTQLEE